MGKLKLKNITILPTLEKFLREERVLTKFKANVRNQSGNTLVKFVPNIRHAFVWLGSPEGDPYWSYINRKYVKILNNEHKPPMR